MLVLQLYMSSSLGCIGFNYKERFKILREYLQLMILKQGWRSARFWMRAIIWESLILWRRTKERIFTFGSILMDLYPFQVPVESLYVLLAPSGPLMFILVYYIHTAQQRPPFSDSMQSCLYTCSPKCLKDPTCASFLKGMGFKDIKYDIWVCQLVLPFNWSPTIWRSVPASYGHHF